MLPTERTRLRVEPAALLLWAAFICLSDLQMLFALLLSAIPHELGHYLVLRHYGGRVERLHITALGAEMQMSGRLSYGAELLATLAGPLTNLLLAIPLGLLGQWWETAYLFAGVQLVLGAFNLMPILPLDGGSILWIAVAWCTEPYTADRAAGNIGMILSLTLLALAVVLLCRFGGSIFPLWAALGLTFTALRQKGLVKWPRKR